MTVSGRLLLDSVGKSLDQIRNGLDRIETYMDDSLVTLVCPAPIAEGWLQPRLEMLLREHPALCPIISIDETARYIDEMDVDIAITREPLRQRGVFEVPLLEDELVAVVHADSADKAAAGLLCLESDRGRRRHPLHDSAAAGLSRRSEAHHLPSLGTALGALALAFAAAAIIEAASERFALFAKSTAVMPS